MGRYVVVFDTPGIKNFVFGTDSLGEIRGASALLDRLNRVEMRNHLEHRLGSANVELVFANGGLGQFIVSNISEDQLLAAVDDLARFFRNATGDEVRLIGSYAPLAGGRHCLVRTCRAACT